MTNILEGIKQEIYKRVLETGFDYSIYAKMNNRQCDLCGKTSENWRVYAHQDRYGLPVRSMQCKKCGLIFITPVMECKGYDIFYEQWYRKLVDAFNGKESGNEVLDYSRQMQSDMMMKFLGEHLPNDLVIKTMLDIGGSTGVFAKKVCDVTGAKGTVIDFNSKELKEAADKGFTVSVTTFEKYKTVKKFDLISMLRTVEHLQYIGSSLSYVKNLLNKNGVFLLDIVNHNWLIKHFKNPCLTTKIDCIYQLTDKTISRYLDTFGFEIIGNSNKDARYISYLAKVK